MKPHAKTALTLALAIVGRIAAGMRCDASAQGNAAAEAALGRTLEQFRYPQGVHGYTCHSADARNAVNLAVTQLTVSVAGFMSGSVKSIEERLGGSEYHAFHRGGANHIA